MLHVVYCLFHRCTSSTVSSEAQQDVCFFIISLWVSLVIPQNPEKKGWTLNSAGYLLGPYAYRSLNVRHRATGKRDMWNESSSLPASSYSHGHMKQ
uniref:Si:rp71-1c10.8 n=1 Tax=Cyprinus carpio TaxID=7962 RepID=A0A8C2F6W2_CYPCA